MRGTYFATHFGNWYEKASERELADYVRELKHWGCNSVSAWFDMHDFTGVDDPRAAKRLDRIRTIYRLCAANGIETGMLVLANEAFKTSPENLRADWRAGKNGYTSNLVGHYHVEICPSRPGGVDAILAGRKAVFSAFADTPPARIVIFPYDQGGCTCAACAPWGANGYLRAAEQVAGLARRTFPGVGIDLSTWRFDAFGPALGEWRGLAGRRDAVRKWADRLFVDADQLARLEADPILPYFPMTEISMARMLPWGGFGANPRPAEIERVLLRHPKSEGAMPYSEGVYEDLNKCVGLALLSGLAATAREATGLYAARHFGEATRAAVAEAAELLEKNQGHEAFVVQDGRRFDFYSLASVDPARPWQLEASVGNLDAARAARALGLLREAEKSMTPEARKSWRWRILMLRAEIDAALAQGAKLDALEPRFDELADIYHVDGDTLPCLVPPTRKRLRPGPDVLRHGAF